jgi:hypothetical protein
MAGTRTPPPSERRLGAHTSSPRPRTKGTDRDTRRHVLSDDHSVSDAMTCPDSTGTLCRNLTIYGFCRYENKGWISGHERRSMGLTWSSNQAAHSIMTRRHSRSQMAPGFLNPLLLRHRFELLTVMLCSSLGRGKFNVDSPAFTPSTPPKNLISPKAADAAPFTPRGSAAAGEFPQNTQSIMSFDHRAYSPAGPPMLGTLTPPVQPQFQDTTNR